MKDGRERRLKPVLTSPLPWLLACSLTALLAGCDNKTSAGQDHGAGQRSNATSLSATYRTDLEVRLPARACILKDSALSASGPLDFNSVVKEASISRLALAGPLQKDDVSSIASALLSSSCYVFIGTKDETRDVARSAEHLGARMNMMEDVLTPVAAQRLVDAQHKKEAAERRAAAESQVRHDDEQREHARCARDSECVRAAAEVMGTYACMSTFAAARRLEPQARDYQMQMVETVRVFQAMRIAQANWAAIQSMGKANALLASNELASDAQPSEEAISAVCYGAVLADPLFDKLVARATL